MLNNHTHIIPSHAYKALARAKECTVPEAVALLIMCLLVERNFMVSLFGTYSLAQGGVELFVIAGRSVSHYAYGKVLFYVYII